MNLWEMIVCVELKILQGRETSEVKAKLYKNTEVRYNNALFFKYSPIQLFTEKITK